MEITFNEFLADYGEAEIRINQMRYYGWLQEKILLGKKNPKPALAFQGPYLTIVHWYLFYECASDPQTLYERLGKIPDIGIHAVYRQWAETDHSIGALIEILKKVKNPHSVDKIIQRLGTCLTRI